MFWASCSRFVGIHPFVSLWAGILPRAEDVQLDWRVLLFALGGRSLTLGLFQGYPSARNPKPARPGRERHRCLRQERIIKARDSAMLAT